MKPKFKKEEIDKIRAKKEELKNSNTYIKKKDGIL